MLAAMAQTRQRNGERGCCRALKLFFCVLLSLVSTHSLLPAPQELKDGALAEALAALDSGDNATAERAFRRLLLEDPDRFEALVGWARSLAAQGRGNEALPSLLRAGERRMAAGGYGEAVELFELATVLDPDSAENQARLGRALILDRRYLSAEQPLRQALNEGERRPEWVLQLAGVLWEKGDLDEAEDLYREALERVPTASVTWYQLGRFLLWRGRYEEAAATLTRAQELGATGFAIELDRGRALEAWARELGSEEGSGGEQREVLERALAAFWLAVEQAPEHSGIRYGLARALERLGDREEAQRQLEIYQRLHREDQARTREKGLTQARLDQAYDLLRHNQAREAIEILESLPQSVEVLQALAIAHREDGDPQAALLAIERALALAPDRPDLRALHTEYALATGKGK